MATPAVEIDLQDPSSPAYKAMERRIVRKQDWRILPLLCTAYLLNYLDRTSLGNSRTLNSDEKGQSLVETLNLKGDRYNNVAALFYVFYCLLEPVSNLLLKRFTPSKHLSRIIVCFGIITICTAAVSSYEGLIAVRMVLGAAEAGYFPGVIMYLCFWYTPSERATRMAIFSASVSASGAFGGLIATGVSFMNGLAGMKAWQWLFVLEGIPAVLIGIAIWFFLPDYPETASFLTPEERSFATMRMGPFAPKGTDKHFDKKQAIAIFKDKYFYLFAIAYFAYANSLNATGYFLPTIIANMGFKGYRSQLLTVPPQAFAFFVIIGNSYHSDKVRERPLHILGGTVLTGTGYILLAACTSLPARYIGTMFMACTNSAVMPFLAYRSAMVSGATSTALAMSCVIGFSNTAGIVAPFLFPSRDGPNYAMGNWTCFALLAMSGVIVSFVWWRLGGSSEYRGSASFLGVADETMGPQDGLETKRYASRDGEKVKEEEAIRM